MFNNNAIIFSTGGGANKSLNKQPLNYREENQNLKFPIKEVLNYYD